MGLFSFLTGKGRDEATRRSTDDAPGPTEAGHSTPPPTAMPADAAAREETATPDSANASAAKTGAGSTTPGDRWPDTPFTPPEAWNTGALTAPPPAPTDGPAVGPADPAETAALQGPIIEVLKTVYDPEIPVDIYELGLVYDIIVDAEKRVLVKMTLTSPACPSAQQIPSEARFKIKALPGVTDAWVEIVWEPPWDKDRMSEAAKLALGIF